MSSFRRRSAPQFLLDIYKRSLAEQEQEAAVAQNGGRHTRSTGDEGSDQLITAIDKEVIDQSDIIMTFLNKSEFIFLLMIKGEEERGRPSSPESFVPCHPMEPTQFTGISSHHNIIIYSIVHSFIHGFTALLCSGETEWLVLDGPKGREGGDCLVWSHNIIMIKQE